MAMAMARLLYTKSSNATFLSSTIVYLLLFLQLVCNSLANPSSASKVHIVYMGRRPHDDVELITSSHHEMLTSVLGSKEAAAESIIYSYKHGFSGFAAKLTDSHARKIAELPGVLDVMPNRLYKFHTTRSWDYLGVSVKSPYGLLHDTKMGDGTIIGVMDSGIWPESETFRDDGLGPIPKKWKGICESGANFNSTNCNKKLIGARYFLKGLEAALGRPVNDTTEYLSPRDKNGHGTHTSSTAGGSIVNGVSYFGIANGTLRGGAPRARLAMYKVSWDEGGTSADVLKGIDEAIHDGVDVINLSLGFNVPLYSEVDHRDIIYYGSLHAVENGIVVVCSAGNEGPNAGTVANIAPWVVTVAASTIDRTYPTMITLGNNQSFVGQSIFLGKDTGFISLVFPENSDDPTSIRFCKTLTSDETWASGHIVLCFHNGVEGEVPDIRENVQASGALGLIIATNPSKTMDFFISEFPLAQVNYEIGTQILNYIRYARNPKVQLRSSKAHIGRPVSTNVASFSSRGPNSMNPAILKPDIAAPGVNILASYPGGIQFLSGTSMSTPHVTGIAALLKSAHPDWSPAAIKSAMVTTVWINDPSSGEPIFSEGNTFKIADPFDLGAGIVNPNKATDPGLIYDLEMADYVHYLCSTGYNDTSISQLVDKPTSCSGNKLSVLNLNLPSITIPSLTTSVTVTRTVTNVGAPNSQYKAIIQHPQGIFVAVKPNVLIFNSKMRKISFAVTISTSYKYNTGYLFGSLTWTDGKYTVRIPVSAKVEYPELPMN